MSNYTQFINITDSVSSAPTTCVYGPTCAYFPASTDLVFLGYGHRVTLTVLASDQLPSRLGVRSNDGEAQIDLNPPHVGQVTVRDFILSDTFIQFEYIPSLAGANFNVRIDYDFAPGETPADGFCAYGTRVQSGVQNALIITEGLVAAAAILVPEYAWAEVALGTLIGLTFPAGNVCSGPPPSIPSFSPADFVLGTDIPLPSTLPKLMTLFEALLWNTVCECIPASGGHPPAVPFPLPRDGAPPPLAAPPPALINCDQSDLCASLDKMSRMLRTITAQLAAVLSDVTLVQRQGVPFAYIRGTAHVGLIGLGDFTVSGLIGLAVDFTTIPPIYPPIAGDPATYHKLAKITIGTMDGWERSWHATHDPYLILPIVGAITKVGYNLPDGIVATITELVREP